MEKNSAKTTLFEKAMELFRTEGYDNVTIQQICKESKLTRNAFYYYFNSKEELLSSYFENIPRFTETLLADVLALPDDWDKLKYIITAHIKLAESEGLSVCRAFIKVSMDGNGDLLAKYYVSENVTIPLVRNCQNSGSVRNMTDAEELVYLATRLMLGILVTWCCRNGEFDLISVSMEAFDSLMQPSR